MITAKTTITLPRAVESDVEFIAIGDVHGRADCLSELIDKARAIPVAPGCRRINLSTGDLIDRGPDSLSCIDMAMDFFDITLMGNHEQMLAIALAEPDTEAGEVGAHNWLRNGGIKIVQQLMRSSPEADEFDLPVALGAHRVEWLMSLRSHHISGGVLFVHAGINPDIALDEFLSEPWLVNFSNRHQFQENMHWAWVRSPFLNHRPGPEGHCGHFVVHGHTFCQNDPLDLKQQIASFRLNLDGGSFETGIVNMAHICGNELTLYSAVC